MHKNNKKQIGKGIGSECLKEGIEKVKALGFPVLLSTQADKNLNFYGKLGFVLKWEGFFSFDGTPETEFKTYFMLNDI
jgi:GNAT superfamily N-acetyltransferase